MFGFLIKFFFCLTAYGQTAKCGKELTVCQDGKDCVRVETCDINYENCKYTEGTVIVDDEAEATNSVYHYIFYTDGDHMEGQCMTTNEDYTCNGTTYFCEKQDYCSPGGRCSNKGSAVSMLAAATASMFLYILI